MLGYSGSRKSIHHVIFNIRTVYTLNKAQNSPYYIVTKRDNIQFINLAKFNILIKRLIDRYNYLMEIC